MSAAAVGALAVTWAALTLSAAKCVLHPLPVGWDVELPDGSWRAANDWRELCNVAREVRHAQA